MPIYDYRCTNCRTVTEVIHGINAAGPRFCPSCGAEGTMNKAMSTPAVHFKGSGWAKKDRSSSSSARTKASAAASSSDGASGDGSSKSETSGESPSGSSDANGSGSSKEPSTSGSKKPAASAGGED